MRPRTVRPRNARILVGLILIAAIALLIASHGLQAERLSAGTPDEPDFGRVTMIGTESFQARDASQDIRLETISHHGDPSNLLYLDFDQPAPQLLRDAAGRYQIKESSYIQSPDVRHGSGAALFNRLENRVVVASPEELWPGTGNSDDFTIEMWIRPIYFYRKNVIFRKMSMLGGERRGLEITIEDDRLVVDAHKLFEDAGGRLHSVRLVSRSGIRTGQWWHVSLTFEAARGRLRLYINGEEERVSLAKDASGVWRLRFHPLDRSPFLIGESYAGSLDEFRITARVLSPEDGDLKTSLFPRRYVNFETMRARQKMGQVISGVLLPGGGRVRSGRVRFLGEEPPGTILNFYIRSSTEPFAADAPAVNQLAWRRVDSRGDLKQSFAYFQWKAELQADPDGRKSPILREVQLDFSPLEAPPPPADLRLAEGTLGRNGHRQLVLEWDLSPDTRVEQGGYYVYYGLRPGEYLGRLKSRRAPDGSAEKIRALEDPARFPVTGEELGLASGRAERLQRLMRNRVRLIVDNDLIQLNTEHGPGARRLPFLRENRTYYFAVSAYDEDGVESRLSNEIIATIKPPLDE